MASKRRGTISLPQGQNMFLLIAVFIVGLVAGFLIAKDRYMGKITAISTMNMEKATQIDKLTTQLQVLGASDSVEK